MVSIVPRMIDLSVLILCTCLGIASCGGQPGPVTPAEPGVDVDALPGIVTDEVLLGLSPSDLLWGFAGKDVSSRDFRQVSLPLLSTMTYCSNTQWRSDWLPHGFAPEDWLERATNPGLGIRDLHETLITGRGVNVAVIDKPILKTHREFEGRFLYREVAAGEHGSSLHFHGMACASVLGGRTTGVAPGAFIHYYAVPDRGDNFRYYIEALREINQHNRDSNIEDAIRIVSISDGLPHDSPHRAEWETLVLEARESGMLVLYSNLAGEAFAWGGAPPYLSVDDMNNHEPSGYFTNLDMIADRIVVPGDYRTTAGNYDERHYIYWGRGGFSWAIPYLAGTVALGLQVRPEMDPWELFEILSSGAHLNDSNYRILDPAGFIGELSGLDG